MRKFLIVLIFASLFLMVSCGEGNINDTDDMDNTEADSVDFVNSGSDDDIGDTGNTGDSGNTGDTNYQWSCPENNKFCHSHGGLNWSDVGFLYVGWNYAVNYCIELGGRLPTISELRTLVQSCSGTETGGDCGITDSCLSIDCMNESCSKCEYDESIKYSVFGDEYYFWSSSEILGHELNAWGVDFYDGSVKYTLKTGNGSTNYVRCVQQE